MSVSVSGQRVHIGVCECKWVCNGGVGHTWFAQQCCTSVCPWVCKDGVLHMHGCKCAREQGCKRACVCTRVCNGVDLHLSACKRVLHSCVCAHVGVQ